MGGAPDSFIFFQVSSTLAKQAFAFHQSVSSSNEHIWPRTEEEIRKFSDNGELFAVRKEGSGALVGLCYTTLEGNEWELGGLVVVTATQSRGLGTLLVRFALAHTIAFNRPWIYGQELIAHVHEANDKPRNLLKEVGFEQAHRVTIPGDNAPLSMKRDAQGNVVGDKFRFPQSKAVKLSNWFDHDFEGTLSDGATPCSFEVPMGGLDGLRQALREALNDSAEQVNRPQRT